MIKIAPVSADLLIKQALGAAAVAALVYVAKSGAKSLQGAIDAVTGLPGRALDAVTGAAQAGGAAWLDGYAQNPAPSITAPSGYGGKYKDPMISDDGIDYRMF